MNAERSEVFIARAGGAGTPRPSQTAAGEAAKADRREVFAGPEAE